MLLSKHLRTTIGNGEPWLKFRVRYIGMITLPKVDQFYEHLRMKENIIWLQVQMNNLVVS